MLLNLLLVLLNSLFYSAVLSITVAIFALPKKKPNITELSDDSCCFHV